MATDSTPTRTPFEIQRWRDQYAAYAADQRAVAMVATWPSCEHCRSGVARPCKSNCPSIAHIYT